MDKQTYDALYQDVICKSYCDIEVPSRVLELQRNGKTFLGAIRKVMKERILEGVKNGTIKAPLPQVLELLEDLEKPKFAYKLREDGSKNLKRLEKRIGRDSGIQLRRSKRTTINAGLTEREHSKMKTIARARGESLTGLTTRIVKEWLKRQDDKEE